METINQEQQHISAKPRSTKKAWLVAAIFILIVGSVWAYALLGRQEQSKSTDLAQYMDPVDEDLQERAIELDITDDEMVEQSDLPPIDDSQSAVGDAQLYLESDQAVYNQGDQIELTLFLKMTDIPDGVQFVINYDQALLSKVEVESINTFGSYITQRVEANEGAIKGMLLRDVQETVNINEPLPLLKITGVADQAGSFTFSFDEEKTQVAATAGQDVLQSAVELIIVVE